MELLILSDSHRDLKNMRRLLEISCPSAVFHLGDHDSDATMLAKEFPNIPFYCVCGNCDSLCPTAPTELVTELAGVRIFATHGHKYNVKSGMMSLVMSARQAEAQLVLFGHTHQPMYEEHNGVHYLNPGSAKGYGASYGLAYVHEGQVVRCELKKMPL